MLDRVNENQQREKRNKELLNSSLDSITNESELEEHSLSDMLMSVEEAFDSYKVAFEKSKNVIVPNVTPIGQSIITTAALMNLVEQKKHLAGQDLNIDTFDALKRSVAEVQVVVAVGPACTEVKKGDLVKFRISDFSRIQNPNSVNSKEVFELPLEKIGEQNYIEMHERNVKYIFDGANIDLSTLKNK